MEKLCCHIIIFHSHPEMEKGEHFRSLCMVLDVTPNCWGGATDGSPLTVRDNLKSPTTRPIRSLDRVPNSSMATWPHPPPPSLFMAHHAPDPWVGIRMPPAGATPGCTESWNSLGQSTYLPSDLPTPPSKLRGGWVCGGAEGSSVSK